MSSKIRKLVKLVSEQGLKGLLAKIKDHLAFRREKASYRQFLKKNEITEAERIKLRERYQNFSRKPLISVIMPVYDVEEKWLRRCIESVIGQIYQNWELCIADDASRKLHVRRLLNEYAVADNRIRVVFRKTNGHISAASNSAIEMATGEFLAFLDDDDELAEDALFRVAEVVASNPGVQMIYTDEDLMYKGRRILPKFKPDWSPDLLLSLNLVKHLLVFLAHNVREVGGFRIGFEGGQDYYLKLPVNEKVE